MRGAHFKGHREYSAHPAPFYVKANFIIAALQTGKRVRLACGVTCVFVSEQVVRVENRQVVYAVRNVFFDKLHIVLQGGRKTAFIKPYAYADAIFAYNQHGIQFCGFKTACNKQRKLG